MDKSILLVEDEAVTAMVLRKKLEKLGYKVSEIVSSGVEAINAAMNEKPVCILMDINLIGDMDGIEAAEEIQKKQDVNIVYITGYSTKEIRERALKTGPVAYLAKPINMQELDEILKEYYMIM